MYTHVHEYMCILYIYISVYMYTHIYAHTDIGCSVVSKISHAVWGHCELQNSLLYGWLHTLLNRY